MGIRKASQSFYVAWIALSQDLGLERSLHHPVRDFKNCDCLLEDARMKLPQAEIRRDGCCSGAIRRKLTPSPSRSL